MKARIVMMALAVALCTMAVGCKYLPESVGPNTSQTGEVWYVKQTWFLLTWKTQVFYCPAPKSPGPATCIAAIMHAEGEMPAGVGFGQPQPQPMPAQPAPAYGQPAAPAGGGFGQPAPSDPDGFGQPAPPAQPGAPGYQPQPAPTPPPPPPPSY